jgi:hypothetical protein
MRFSHTVLIGILSVVLVSCVHLTRSGRATMTIRAIGPTGYTWYQLHPQPIWTFAITNTGSCEVEWRASVEVRGGSDREYSQAGGSVEWPEGLLASGHGLHTNMIVPAKSGGVWRADVDYWPTTAKGGSEIRTYNDKWH